MQATEEERQLVTALRKRLEAEGRLGVGGGGAGGPGSEAAASLEDAYVGDITCLRFLRARELCMGG